MLCVYVHKLRKKLKHNILSVSNEMRKKLRDCFLVFGMSIESSKLYLLIDKMCNQNLKNDLRLFFELLKINTQKTSITTSHFCKRLLLNFCTSSHFTLKTF